MTATVIPFPPLRSLREMVARLPVLSPEDAERKLRGFVGEANADVRDEPPLEAA